MSAVDDVLGQLKTQNKRAFMPFVTAGDPDLEFTKQIIMELDRRGATMCEVGIPYSDPIADGPVIQASYTRALDKHVKLADIFAMTKSVSSEISMPLVCMVSYAIVYRHGLEAFVSDAKEAGFAGAIVPDLLVDEADELSKICQAEDFNLIQLVTPTTPRDRAVRIANSSTGFLYYVSITGITGERAELPPEVVDQVGWLRQQTDLPICVGFGISKPEHVRTLLPVADGMIVGSAIVKRVATANDRDRAEVAQEVGDFVASLMVQLQ
ncbi:MAG: tryptophan synthase subunit alpha [Planctomycetales bacterium]|nr:tryptophan synthase subunit alpha [Planctomycetales bacterium]